MTKIISSILIMPLRKICSNQSIYFNIKVMMIAILLAVIWSLENQARQVVMIGITQHLIVLIG